MSDTLLRELAETAGIETRWKDVHGTWHDVGVDTLRYVLSSQGLPAASPSLVADTLGRLRDVALPPPPLLTAIAGQTLTLPDGRDITAPGPGYHLIEVAGREVTLAVAHPGGFPLQQALGGRRGWALAAQLYSLRRKGDGGLGDLGGLREFIRSAARHGADAVAISPMHAQFSADPDRFSPYAPSSRVMSNVLHAEIDMEDAGDAPLVDWPQASRRRQAALRAQFAALTPPERATFEAWRKQEGDALETHARFEALHAFHFNADPSHWHWSRWPAGHRDPHSAEVAAFAQEQANEVALHSWMQFRAQSGLRAAQAEATAAGMKIGLIADLAVGVDSGGSQCWSRQNQTLIGLSIGAPPDLLSPAGQGWGITAFSPRGLEQGGYAAFLEMLRAAMRHAGGVRIDHVMGLRRLWVIPDGASSRDGAYLRLPVQDMLRLVALESHLNQAVVLGEDLGTVPEGFTESLDESGIAGLRVLWFERESDGPFKPPRDWTRGAAAMTSTHDLATVAGWWEGRDIALRASLGIEADADAAGRERDRDRSLLWQAMRDSGAAQDTAPPAHDTWPAVDAAVRHVGLSACDLVVLPAEDALALPDQPNLPGTLDEHPNWRRRLPGDAATLLDEPHVAARLAGLDAARKTIA